MILQDGGHGLHGQLAVEAVVVELEQEEESALRKSYVMIRMRKRKNVIHSNVKVRFYMRHICIWLVLDLKRNRLNFSNVCHFRNLIDKR